jgi:hypothetical protein
MNLTLFPMVLSEIQGKALLPAMPVLTCLRMAEIMRIRPL